MKFAKLLFFFLVRIYCSLLLFLLMEEWKNVVLNLVRAFSTLPLLSSTSVDKISVDPLDSSVFTQGSKFLSWYLL